MTSGVTPIGQGWTNARGLRGLGAPSLTLVCALFLTLPVTVASAERSFYKLKLIKTYLRSTMAQDRLDGLSLLAIERDAAQKLDIDSIIASCKH